MASLPIWLALLAAATRLRSRRSSRLQPPQPAAFTRYGVGCRLPGGRCRLRRPDDVLNRQTAHRCAACLPARGDAGAAAQRRGNNPTSVPVAPKTLTIRSARSTPASSARPDAFARLSDGIDPWMLWHRQRREPDYRRDATSTRAQATLRSVRCPQTAQFATAWPTIRDLRRQAIRQPELQSDNACANAASMRRPRNCRV